MRGTSAEIFGVVGLLLVGIGAESTSGASYSFDLTESVGEDFLSFPETAVDLGVQFRHIERATILIEGTFTPGIVTPVTVPEHTGPVLESDSVTLLTRLDEVGSPWIEKRSYAIQELVGIRGEFFFSLPLLAAESTSVPVLFPSGEGEPDFDFLRDGRFGLAAGTMHMLASLYRVLEPPVIKVSRFELRVDGEAVPEPTTTVLAATVLLAGFVFSRRQRCS